MNKKTVLRFLSILFFALTLVLAILWVLKETGTIQLERPSDLTVPTIACGLIAFSLSQLSKRANK